MSLAEAGTEFGGRVSRESRLPGLAEWARVRDWRVGQIRKMPNVDVYFDSTLDAQHLREFGFRHVVLATGARWRADGFGRANFEPIPGATPERVTTPDRIMNGELPAGPVVVFDDDHYYMGNLMAEVLRRAGRDVTLVTPAAEVAAFTAITLELARVARHMHALGITMITHHNLAAIGEHEVVLRHVHTAAERSLDARGVVLVTARLPEDGLYRELMADRTALARGGIGSVTRIGDCLAPGAIVHATFAGYRYACELDTAPEERLFRHELPRV